MTGYVREGYYDMRSSLVLKTNGEQAFFNLGKCNFLFIKI